MDSLQKLVCANCGAGLPAEKTATGAIRCAHCGTLYLPPQGRGGGVHISGGPVTIGGDLVSGDKTIYIDQRPRSLLERLLALLRPKGESR